MPPLQANPLYSFWYMAVCGGERFTDRRCRGRRPRRPAEVSGGAKVHGRDESLPLRVTSGAVKTAPYDAKDKRAATAGSRAGHARPLRNVVKWDVGRPDPRPPGTLAAA